MLTLTRFSQIAFIATFFASTSWAEEDSTIRSSQIFASEIAAVKAAADSYNPISITEDRKFMGVILLEDGNYSYTVSAGDVGAESVSMRINQSDLTNVVAYWRTEGSKKPYPSYFTDLDTDTVKRLGRPLYLANSSGKLKVFQPTDRVFGRMHAYRLGHPIGYASGEDVRDAQDHLVRVNTEIRPDRLLISQQP